MEIFKSIVFKHQNILYLGLKDESDKITKFKVIDEHGTYAMLKEDQFSIVFVEKDDKHNIKLSELQTITFKDEENPNKEVIIGTLDNEILFNVANDILDMHKKVTIH
jgi:hypothetical protein